MDCDVAREAISARIDGEREPVPSARVDEHLAGCPDCADWQARATAQAQLLRALGGRESTGPAVVADPDPAPAATRRAWPVARIGLGAVGVVQVALALAQAATGDLGVGHGGGHLLNESTAWSVALGVMMIGAALRPAAAAGLAGVLAVFSVALTGYVVADAVGGAVSGMRMLSHLPVLAGTVLAVLVWRGARRPSGPPAAATPVLADVVPPEDSTPARRRGHLRPAG